MHADLEMENSFIIGRDVIRDQTNIPIRALWCYPGSLSLSDFLILSYRDLGADADDCFSGLRNKSPRTKNERRRHASLDLSTLIPPPRPAIYWFPFLLASLPLPLLPSHVFSMRGHELHSWFCSAATFIPPTLRENRFHTGHSSQICLTRQFVQDLPCHPVPL